MSIFGCREIFTTFSTSLKYTPIYLPRTLMETVIHIIHKSISTKSPKNHSELYKRILTNLLDILKPPNNSSF